MSEARKQQIATWFVGVFVSLLAVTAFVVPAVWAQGEDTSAAPQPGPAPGPLKVRDPFSPYPIGPETISYEQLADGLVAPPGGETKAMVDQVGENSDLNCPPAAHQAW